MHLWSFVVAVSAGIVLVSLAGATVSAEAAIAVFVAMLLDALDVSDVVVHTEP